MISAHTFLYKLHKKQYNLFAQQTKTGKTSKQVAAEVAGVAFSDSDSAPVPKS